MSCKFQLVMSLLATFWGHSTEWHLPHLLLDVAAMVVVPHCGLSLTGFSSPSLMKTKKHFLTKFHWYNIIVRSKVSLFHRWSVHNFHRIHTLHKCITVTISVHDSCMVITIKSSVYYTGYATSTASHGLTPVTPPITTNIYLHIHQWSCWKWFNRV